MKIKKISINNKKRGFEVLTKKGPYFFPFSRLRLIPSAWDPLIKVYVDPELGHEGFTYILKSGKEDSVPMDAVLDYNKDPDYEHEMLLYKLTVQALELIEKNKIKKREIARRLHTSPAHLYRLLNTAFYGKTIDQMVKLLAALDHRVELVLKKVA